jgi:hypothetical protein
MKHVVIDLHFVRERVTISDVRVLHMPTISQLVNIFTKGLSTQCFQSFDPVSTFAVARVSTVGGGVLETYYIIGIWVRDHLMREVWPDPLGVIHGGTYTRLGFPLARCPWRSDHLPVGLTARVCTAYSN